MAAEAGTGPSAASGDCPRLAVGDEDAWLIGGETEGRNPKHQDDAENSIAHKFPLTRSIHVDVSAGVRSRQVKRQKEALRGGKQRARPWCGAPDLVESSVSK